LQQYKYVMGVDYTSNDSAIVIIESAARRIVHMEVLINASLKTLADALLSRFQEYADTKPFFWDANLNYILYTHMQLSMRNARAIHRTAIVQQATRTALNGALQSKSLIITESYKELLTLWGSTESAAALAYHGLYALESGL